MASTIEEIEKRRADRKAAAETAREEQYAKDLEVLDVLEGQYGASRVARLDLAGYVPGLPTFVVVRAPTSLENKRFNDLVRRGEAKLVAAGPAADMLAEVCIVYPDADTYKSVRESFAAIHNDAFAAAHKLAGGKAVDEGKG